MGWRAFSAEGMGEGDKCDESLSLCGGCRRAETREGVYHQIMEGLKNLAEETRPSSILSGKPVKILGEERDTN